jgi:hypothetical protein
MDDSQIHATVEQLVAEEHQLWERESAGEASEDDRRRLEALKVSLDQCWDLLRQRRALREAGRDPDDAGVRRPEVVERYEPPDGRHGRGTWRRRSGSSCARKRAARQSCSRPRLRHSCG